MTVLQEAIAFAQDPAALACFPTCKLTIAETAIVSRKQTPMLTGNFRIRWIDVRMHTPMPLANGRPGERDCKTRHRETSLAE